MRHTAVRRVATVACLAGVLLLLAPHASADEGDILVVRTFTFDDIEMRRGVFEFPDDGRTWERILMRYTLKCDEATVGDPYPCGERDNQSAQAAQDRASWMAARSPLTE